MYFYQHLVILRYLISYLYLPVLETPYFQDVLPFFYIHIFIITVKKSSSVEMSTQADIIMAEKVTYLLPLLQAKRQFGTEYMQYLLLFHY